MLLKFVPVNVDGKLNHYSIYHADTNTHLGYLSEHNSDDGYVYSCNAPVALNSMAMHYIARRIDCLNLEKANAQPQTLTLKGTRTGRFPSKYKPAQRQLPETQVISGRPYIIATDGTVQFLK